MKQIQNVIIALLLSSIIIACNNTVTKETDFIIIENQNIVTDSGFSQGAAWGDYDNDGNEDLYVTNSWTNANNLLYRNKGDGTFEKITDIAPVNGGGNSNGCTWGDVDNDDDLDLFVANVNDQKNFFYLNIGNGTFSSVENVIPVIDKGWSYTAIWGDYNNDGWIDLFVGNYQNQKNFLYANNGAGELIKIEDSIVTQSTDWTQGSVWFDFNNDGRIDLYVANKGLNNLFRNLGNGNFEKVTGIPPVEDEGNSFGCSVGDYNNDGKPDLFVANWWGKNHLYENVGDGKFKKITGSPVTEESLNSEGSSWGDYDNDGDLDLLVTNDGNNSIFENNSGSFLKKEKWIVANDSSNSNGVTWNDFDGDGDLDIFIANGGNQPNLLYENLGNNNRWVKLKCVGTKSNKSAFGTKIFVYQPNGLQFREINSQTGGGYGAQNGLIQHFGLGNRGKIDSIIIRWPSKIVTKINNPKVNKSISIIEGK